MAALAVVPARRSTSIIAEEIRREVDAAEADFQSAVAHAIRAGELLIEAKGELRHGEWIPWLTDNFPGSRRTAERYMAFAKNATTVAHLGTVTEAIAGLSTPKPEPEPSVCGWSGCDEPPTHFTRADTKGWEVSAMNERMKGNPNAGSFGFCLEHAEANAKFHNDAVARRAVCRRDGCEEVATHDLDFDAEGESVPVVRSNGPLCFAHAEAKAQVLNQPPGLTEVIEETPAVVASGVAGNPTQAQVDEARHGEGNPYGPPPRRPEHVEKMHAPMKEKPPVKGAAKDSGPWVVECPDCHADLYRIRRDRELADDLAAWQGGSTVAMPSMPVETAT